MTFKSVSQPAFSDKDYDISVPYEGEIIFHSNTSTYLLVTLS